MSQVRGLVSRIPVPRAGDDQDTRVLDPEATQTPEVPPRKGGGDSWVPDRTINYAPSAGIYSSDAELAALSIETRIKLIGTFVKELKSGGSGGDIEQREATRRQLSSVMKTLKTPEDFDRVFHSIDARSVLNFAPDSKRIRAQFQSNLRKTTPGDWGAYSRYLDNVTGTTPTTGNRMELLSEGAEVMARVTEDVRNARKSIDINMYKWEPDEVGIAFAAALAAKANPADPSEPKVRVRVMIDRQGSFDKDPEGTHRMLQGLVRNGVEVIVQETGLLRDNLDHRKVVVIDGTIGYAGGMNIGLLYRDVWRDQLTRIEGPLVQQLRVSVRDRWAQEGGKLRDDDLELQPPPASRGATESRVISHTGRFDDSFIKAAYLKAIYTAERTIKISNPYFTDPDVTQALCDAAKRGVKVQVVLPAVNDVPLLRDAARAGYPKLISAGVEVYEYQGRMSHHKVATIDGTWSTFGSSNLDARSFDYNHELNVFSTDPAVAAELDTEIFEEDLKEGNAIRITSYTPNLKEKLFRAFSGLL